MGLRLFAICALLAVLAGCGDSPAAQEASARQRAHSVVATSLLLLADLQRGAIWPRYAVEHLRDTRKSSLDEIRKDLKDDDSSQAKLLLAQVEQIDESLKDVETRGADAAAVAQAAARLRMLESALRSAEPR